MNKLHTTLVVIQGSPLCNINCRYCYLPDRLSNRRISLATVEKIAERLFESPYIEDEVTIVWHAGEPLVLPIGFYEDAFLLFQKYNKNNVRIIWSLQTNGTLINEQWCEFFKRHNIRVGVSIDGPDYIHDANRVDRAGKGTLSKAIRGLELMREFGLRPGVISVITEATLPYPEELWSFFLESNIGHVSLNIEEVEGSNVESTMFVTNREDVTKQFFKKLLKFSDAQKESPPLREFENVMKHLKSGVNYARAQDNIPMAILNFDCDGNVSTFSPELLTAKHEPYGDFILGNVYSNSLESLLQTDKFIQMNTEIQNGVQKCRSTCSYYMFCGGGWPSNKIGETGSFSTSETKSCRLRVKTVVDAIMDHLEDNVGN